jgi:hypothetical protein
MVDLMEHRGSPTFGDLICPAWRGEKWWSWVADRRRRGTHIPPLCGATRFTVGVDTMEVTVSFLMGLCQGLRNDVRKPALNKVSQFMTESDLHQFDFTSSQWTLVQTNGRRPKPRYRATAVVYKNFMILYGGHDGTRHLSDTHIFDLENRVWSSLITEGPAPVPRDSHIAVAHSNSMYIFGGSSGSAMGDLHELQLPSNPALPAKWRPIKSGNEEPQPRFCHSAVVHNEGVLECRVTRVCS